MMTNHPTNPFVENIKQIKIKNIELSDMKLANNIIITKKQICSKSETSCKDTIWSYHSKRLKVTQSITDVPIRI